MNCRWSHTVALNSLTHTQTEVNPWWNADLGEVKRVKYIKTYNREDCC